MGVSPTWSLCQQGSLPTVAGMGWSPVIGPFQNVLSDKAWQVYSKGSEVGEGLVLVQPLQSAQPGLRAVWPLYFAEMGVTPPGFLGLG